MLATCFEDSPSIARFLPVAKGGGGSNGNTSITIEYKEFGVRLKFKPTVLGDNTIRLQVAPEVSELSDTGAVTIQGFRVPAILTRRAETTLELKSGQTFSLAGLISQRADARNAKTPLLGDLPVLGTLFRSVRYQSGETELVVMVTADLVEPLNNAGKTALPGSLSTPPSRRASAGSLATARRTSAGVTREPSRAIPRVRLSSRSGWAIASASSWIPRR